MDMDTQERLDRILRAVLLEFREMNQVMLSLEQVEDKTIPAPMGTDGVHLVYHPDRLEALEDWCFATALIHEGAHCMLGHTSSARRERMIGPEPPGNDPKWRAGLARCRYAAEIVDNGLLRQLGIRLPDWCIDDATYDGLSWEEVFHQLPDQDYEGLLGQKCHLTCDTQGTQADQEALQKQWKQAFADFLVTAQKAGRLPGDFAERLLEGLKPRIPWEEIVHGLVSVIVRGYESRTWRRPDRRGLAVDLYLPAPYSEALQCLAFISDTSGSMSNEDCSMAVRSVLDAASRLNVRKSIWIECDAVVHRVLEFEDEFVPPQDAKGRGGTDFRPGFEEAMKHDPVLIVYFTDLEGTFPDKVPPVPTIWITRNKDGQAPFGHIVRID